METDCNLMNHHLRLSGGYVKVHLVRATVSGSPAAVRVGSGIETLVQVVKQQTTEWGSKRHVVIQPGQKSTGFWTGWKWTAVVFCGSYHFGCN